MSFLLTVANNNGYQPGEFHCVVMLPLSCRISVPLRHRPARYIRFFRSSRFGETAGWRHRASFGSIAESCYLVLELHQIAPASHLGEKFIAADFRLFVGARQTAAIEQREAVANHIRMVDVV